MKDFQIRVIQEQTELKDKLSALTKFIDGELFKTLSPFERELLLIQQAAMALYADVLTRRILNFME